MADRVTIEAFSFITKMSATDVERSAESAFKTALTQLVVIFPVEEEQKNSILESVYFFSITLCNIPCFFALIGCRSFLQLLIMNLGNRKWTERLQSCWTCDHTYLRWEGKFAIANANSQSRQIISCMWTTTCSYCVILFSGLLCNTGIAAGQLLSVK